MRYTSDITDKKTGDTIFKGTVGVVRKYNKDPVMKVGFEKPVVLELDWGMPPVYWNFFGLSNIVIHEH